MVVTYLALDKIRLANKWLQKNVRLAIKYDSDEHLGYTYMDYAKGIYHLNLSLALKYLELADLHFQMPSEHRRHLDCQCEYNMSNFYSEPAVLNNCSYLKKRYLKTNIGFNTINVI